MKRRRMRVRLAISLLGLFAAAVLAGCRAEPAVLEQNIVFGLSSWGERAILGLVNADGSGLTYLEFE